MKTFASFFLSFFLLFQYSKSQPIFNYPEPDIKGRASLNGAEQEITPVDLPQGIQVRDQSPVFVGNAGRDKKQDQMLEVLSSFRAASLLMNKEASWFVVDTKNKTVEYTEPSYKISDLALEAVSEAPTWLGDQLMLKLRLLAAYGLDDDYAQLILDAPEKQKDEVAFIIAYMSINSLKDNRFLPTKDMISKTAKFIYNVDDSLQYVDLVEHGSYASRDYYTTTKYRIYDPQSGDTIWSELPKELYYFYIVHPKLDQEGVYVKDNSNATEQRTYDYDWRNFIWSNPNPSYDYTKVNKTTAKGSVKTIPLFSEVMKKPRILWKREKDALYFTRQLNDDAYALDALGYWCSHALPVDVTLPRSFQPNQVLIKHNGMCNEDAFLVAAACRTALIPICYLGTWSEDHVFGSVWDQDWNHYEFFRGGLQPNTPDFYGITNMMDRGGYSWENARVEGYRPDGYIEDFTKYYANTCDFEITVTDTNGLPIDGAMITMYAAPSAYNSPNMAKCGYAWTDFNGKANITAGEHKRYLIQAWHPAYGWSPADSTQGFWMAAYPTQAGTTNKVVVPFLNLKKKATEVNSIQMPETGKLGIKANWFTQDILTGVNARDSQKSRFYKWNDKGEVSFFVCDSANLDKFKTGKPFDAYEYRDLSSAGDVTFPLPGEGRWFVVFSNRNSNNFYQKLTAEVSLVEDAVRSAPETGILAESLVVSPNPASEVVSISYTLGRSSNARLSIVNSMGIEIATLSNSLSSEGSYSTTYNVSSLEPGVYFLRLETGRQTISKKMVVVK